VTTPAVERPDYRPVADVFSGSLIRELTRQGGMELLRKDAADKWLADKGYTSGVNNRNIALETGAAFDADIIIFSYIIKRYDDFVYRIVLLEVNRDVVQRTIDGEFRITASPNEIGRLITAEIPKLVRYIPKRAEIADPAFAIRQITIDPERLPPYAEINELPPLDYFGYIEQVFAYYDVYPGEIEYLRFNQQDQIHRLIRSEDMDEELRSQVNQYYMLGDFAIRQGLQAFLIQNCSVRAINVLIANRIPVFVNGAVLVAYDGLTLDGYSMMRTIDNNYIDSLDLTYRDRMAVMIVTPKPGKYRGISKDYLKTAISLYPNEWGETPALVEIVESAFDVSPARLD
jgi:hypothetical protein